MEQQAAVSEAPRSLISRPTRALRGLRRFVLRKPLGAFGAAMILVAVGSAVFAPWVAPYDPNKLNYDHLFAPPGSQFLLGTDDSGRDILSRVIYGARISLYVSILSVGIGTTLGALLGVTSGYFGGKLDFSIQRFVDVLMSFPLLVLALAIVASLGSSLTNVIAAIALVRIPGSARILRSSALSIRENDYISAAKAIGCTDARIVFRHVLPNCVAPYIIIATAGLGTAILTEASLSFLGLGPPPPIPTWGGMLARAGQLYFRDAPWMAFYPGLALTLVVFAFNLLGDALRDTLDPRLRRG